jgi:hypothetical protein
LANENEGISVLSLNRPEARNALGRQLMRELGESLALLRGVSLSGADWTIRPRLGSGLPALTGPLALRMGWSGLRWWQRLRRYQPASEAEGQVCRPPLRLASLLCPGCR